MNDRARFASTMASLALSLPMYGRTLTRELQEVYWAALRGLSDAEFQRAAEVLLTTEKEFPPPARFFAVLLEGDPQADAQRALNAAWRAGRQLTPGQGSWWSGPAILAQVGRAAYEAFHACGGSAAFALVDSEFHGPGIRKAWAEAYRNQVEADPMRALPAPRVEALPPGPDQLALEGEVGAAAEPFDWRAMLREGERRLRDAEIAALRKPKPGPVESAAEQEQLDALGEKLAAKRRQMAPTTDGGTV